MENRLRNDYIPAFVEVLPTSVRCEDQYRVQRGFPRPTALLAVFGELFTETEGEVRTSICENFFLFFR